MNQNGKTSPIYSEVQPNITDMPDIATIEGSSPWKDADVSFHYVKVDFPKLHTHNHWELLIVLSGCVTHEINGQFFTLTKADACLIRPQDRHRLFDSRPSDTQSYQHLNFLVDTQYMQSISKMLEASLYEKLLQSPMPLSFSLETGALHSVHQRTVALQLNSPSSDPTEESLCMCRMIFQELYLIFLKQFMGPAEPYPQWLLKFLMQLQDADHFSMSTEQLVKTTPYSYSRASRYFKQYTGVTILEYITEAKISYAKSLLRNTNMTILEIGSRLEFSASHFDKIFKKKVGIPPGEYRKNHHKL